MSDGGLKSEAGEMDALIAELESARAVNDIAGRRSGFAQLDAALNGLSSGLYLLVGAPGAGKTAFVKQLCDEAARLNPITAHFFAFGETKVDLRIRTLARLSGLESREIRRGAGYLLHIYGISKNPGGEDAAPGWEQLKAAAAAAKIWLDRVYLVECAARTTLEDIERTISAVQEASKSAAILVVIDDAQRLGSAALTLDERLPLVAEKLGELALRLDVPVLATWPELDSVTAPELRAERAVGAGSVMVLRDDRSAAQATVSRARLHIVKNRGGENTKIEFDFTPGLAKFSER